MAMEVQNNSAGRLFDILQSALGSHPNHALRTVWSKALGCDEKNHAELLRLWSELIQLTYKAKTEISGLDNIDEALYLKPFTNIEALLGKVNFDQAWNQVRGHLDETTMQALRFGADLLRRERGNAVQVTDERVESLINELNAVLKRVTDSDLPEKLKLLFVQNLEQLRRALLGFRISGAEGIEQEIDRALGSLLRHRQEVHEAADGNPETKAAITDYFGLVAKVNEAVSFGQNLMLLAAPLLSRLSS